MVCDFKILKEAMSEFLHTLDHALCMNTEDPKYDDFKNTFGERIIGSNKKDPTTEVIAGTIFNVANTKLNEYSINTASKYPLRKRVKLLSVSLWKTSSSWAEFSPKNF